MLRTINLRHDRAVFLLALSKTAERAGYFGIYALITLYIIDDVGMDRNDTMTVFSLFVGINSIFQFVGAIIGDLIIGHRKTAIGALVVQAIGAFLLCMPGSLGLYGGLLLVAIGGGAFGANLAASFGGLYAKKTKLLDSGFTILHIGHSLGPAAGMLLTGMVGERWGWGFGFALAGTFMLLGMIPLFFQSPTKMDISLQKHGTRSYSKILIIVTICLLVGLFTALLKLSANFSANIFSDVSTLNIWRFPDLFWSSYHTLFAVVISIGTAILWSFIYTSQFFKLAVGCFVGVVSFGLLMLTAQMPGQSQAILFFASMFMLFIAEVCVAPVIYSVLTQYANPKYLATLMSLAFIPSATLVSISGVAAGLASKSPEIQTWIGMVGLGVLGLVIMGLIWQKRRAFTIQSQSD